MESTRLDRFLFAIRLYHSRALATDACRGGHVRVNGAAAKASSTVRVGDTVTATIGGRDRVLEVLDALDRRVAAPLAQAAVIDRSAPVPPRSLAGPAFVRDPSSGRPTKRDRRDLDRLRSR